MVKGPERLFQVSKVRAERTTRHVTSNRNQLGRVRARPDRPIGREFFHQAPMVLMGMTDQDGRRAGPIQRRRQQASGAFRCVKWPPGVENKAVAIRVHDFDAGPTDLLRAAMDG